MHGNVHLDITLDSMHHALHEGCRYVDAIGQASHCAALTGITYMSPAGIPSWAGNEPLEVVPLWHTTKHSVRQIWQSVYGRHVAQ